MRSPRLSTLLTGLAIVVVATLGSALPASAVAANFFDTSGTVNNNGSLTVSFHE